MWDWLVDIIFAVLQFIQSIAIDWGLSIIILVLIIRLILTPLQTRATKSTARMQVLQPKLQELQDKYADDPQRLNEEMMKFQAENKFNPLGGCLPLLIQMPVFFALFTVLRDRIPDGGSFYNIIPNLAGTPGGSFASGDIVAALPYLIILALFGVLTLIPTLLTSRNQTGAQASSMKTTAIFMAVFMVVIGWSLPAGVLLYYDTSSAWAVIQQVFITKRVMEQAKAEEEARLASAPVEVDVVRRERKARPHKKH